MNSSVSSWYKAGTDFFDSSHNPSDTDAVQLQLLTSSPKIHQLSPQYSYRSLSASSTRTIKPTEFFQNAIRDDAQAAAAALALTASSLNTNVLHLQTSIASNETHDPTTSSTKKFWFSPSSGDDFAEVVGKHTFSSPVD